MEWNADSLSFSINVMAPRVSVFGFNEDMHWLVDNGRCVAEVAQQYYCVM